MGTSRRTGNLLGAASLALSDLLVSGATEAARTSRSGAAALVVLAHSPGLSVTELGRRTGLSQSAATRMAEGLERQGLMRRESSWANWVGLHLTERGEHAVRGLLLSRGDVLAKALDGLSHTEQEQLTLLLGTLLTGLCQEPGDAERLCRLCDRMACLADEAVCPVGQADRLLRAAEAADGGTGSPWERKVAGRCEGGTAKPHRDGAASSGRG